MTWRELADDKRALRSILAAAVAVGCALVLYARFLVMVEHRAGVVLADPVLAALVPYNMTWPIFIVLYGSLVAAIASILRDPMVVARALRAYAALVVLRMVCMWTVPLDPPPGMIALVDPVVQQATGSGATLTRDLFFSGHTSILTLIAFVLPQRSMRRLFAVLAVLMGWMVLQQHVHYTVDVIVAPLAAFAAVTLTRSRAVLQDLPSLRQG
jgi:hypothetical protein